MLLCRPTRYAEQHVEVMKFSDYKEVPGANGYKIPYTLKMMGGEFKIQTVDINKGIADKGFE